MTDWKPATYPSISPYLICDNAPALITFLQSVFDAELVRRFDRPDGSLMHAEVRIDDSIVMIGGGATDQQAPGPHIHVYVRDAQAVYDRAIQHGAQSVQAPERKRADDDFRGGFRDAAGTTWWVATQ
ncbi:extradiol dioxygenase [Caballeronia megalochromosomata]|jgi:PhnB protein|nr:extradiol dioxygenase [Caballeronia megalochromosomata]